MKNYIRHLELVAGENFIEQSCSERGLGARDLGELRTVAAEIQRDAWQGKDVARVRNCNYRLRVLMNRYGLSAEQVAGFARVDIGVAGRWRANPRSSRYRPMTAGEFSRFESALHEWLEGGRG